VNATLAHLAEKVGRRLREHGLHARTVQLKLRYSDFTTITRAHSLPAPTQIDIDLVNIRGGCSMPTGIGGRRSGLSDSRVWLHRRTGTTEPDRWRPRGTLAAGAGGDG